MSNQCSTPFDHISIRPSPAIFLQISSKFIPVSTSVDIFTTTFDHSRQILPSGGANRCKTTKHRILICIEFYQKLFLFFLCMNRLLMMMISFYIFYIYICFFSFLCIHRLWMKMMFLFSFLFYFFLIYICFLFSFLCIS